MKRSFVVFLGCVLLAGVFSARAQVVPSATGRRLVINAGGEGSAFQPDYTGSGAANSSPNRLYGIGAWVDADFTRWIQIEAEGRWLRWNQYGGIAETTYMAGPRVPVYTWGRITPYGKFLIGWGSDAGSGGYGWLTGRATAWAYGGGVDYRLSRKFTLRYDFEYQTWRVASLHPYSNYGSVGLSYRVF